MKKILLPELYRIDKVGKNIIKHKLFDGDVFDYNSIEVGDHYLLFRNDKGEVICVTQKNKDFPEAISRATGGIA